MSKYLLIDVGAGTMDVFYCDDEAGLAYKAVVASPVRRLAAAIDGGRGDLLVSGGEMGGGAVSQALIRRAQASRVVMAAGAAATVHHDLAKVRSRGIEVVADDEIANRRPSGRWELMHLSDLDEALLRQIVAGFGVPFRFDVLAVCAQDHGWPPAGTSHLDYRHQLFRRALDKSPALHGLLYRAAEVPATLNRLRSIARQIASLPTREAYVMDSGMAAILGASADPLARNRTRRLVLDVATSHTVGAALQGHELAGFFEYHTRDITLSRLEGLLVELAEGRLDHRQILAEGGHGAYQRRIIGWDKVELLVATGPRRQLVARSRLPIHPGAPLGDNMMTGTAGLLAAIRFTKGLDPWPEW